MGIKTVNDIASDAEQQSILGATGNFLTYGLGGMAISAVDSFINTGVELGNFLGGDFDRNNTEDDIRDWLGDDAGNYYKKHSTLVDVGGLVVGSLLPGGLAVKGARALAAGKLETSGSSLVTGWAKSMTDERIVAQATEAVANNVIPATLQGNRLSLLGKGMVKAATENLAYETATLLTMNQSSALNSEDLGYFESIGANIGMSALGVGVGTAIGGGLSYIATKSAFTKFTDALEYATRADKELADTSVNSLAGDFSVVAYDKIGRIDSRLAEIAELPPAEAAQHAKESADLLGMKTQLKNDIIAKLNNNSSLQGYDIGGHIVGSLEQLGDQELPAALRLLARTEKLSGLTKPTKEGSGLSGHLVSDNSSELPSLFVDKYLTGSVDTVSGVARLEADLLQAKLPDADIEALALDAGGLLKASTIKALWTDAVRKRVYFKDAAGQKVPIENVPPEALLKMNLPRRGKPAQYISTMLDVRQGLVDLLTEFDPLYSNMANRIEAFSAKLAEHSRLGKDWDDVTAETYGQLTQAALYDPREMFSAAYRLLNKAELPEALQDSIKGYTGRHRAIYEYLDANKALRSKYGAQRTVVNIKTGQVSDTVTVPYYSDMGKTVVGKASISAGRQALAINPKTVKHFKELDSTDINGLYIWANSADGAGKAVVTPQGLLRKDYADTVTSDNLVMLTAMRKFANFANGGSFRLADTGEQIQSIAQLDDLLTKRKLEYLDELANSTQTKYTDMDLAMRADVSRDVVYARALRTNADAAQAELATPINTKPDDLHFTANNLLRIGSDGSEQIIPQHVVFHYAHSTVDAVGMPMDSLLHAQQRMRIQQDIDREAAMQALGLTPQELSTLGVLPDSLAKSLNLPRQPLAIYKNISGSDSTASMLAGQDAEIFTGQAIAQERGRFRAHIDQKHRTEIIQTFSPIVHRVNNTANDAAKHEISLLLSSVLRQDRYSLGGLHSLGLSEEAVDALGKLGIDLQDEFAEQVLLPYGLAKLDDAGNVTGTDMFIIAQAGKDALSEKSAPLMELLAELGNPESEVASLVNAGGAASELIRTQLRNQVDRLLSEARNVFSQEAKTGQHRMVQPLANAATREFLEAMQQVNATKVLQPLAKLREAENQGLNVQSDWLYAGRPNLDRYPFYAILRQRDAATNPWAAKDSGFILATSEADLQRQSQHILNTYGHNNIEIITGSQLKNNLKARNTYQYELDLTTNAVNTALKNEGKLWDASAQYNPHAMEDYINDLIRRQQNVTTRGLGLLYREDINGLEFLDKALVRTGSFDSKELGVSNYRKNINLMLGLSTGEVNKVWQGTQETVAKAASRLSNIFIGKWEAAKTRDNWEDFAATAERFGLPKLVTGEEQWFVDKAVNKSTRLTGAVSKLNSALSVGMLKMDAAHWVVNAVSLPILAMPAMTEVKRIIATLPERQLQHITNMTTGSLDGTAKMPSNTKLLYQAAANYFKQSERVSEFASRGLIGKELVEMRQFLDNIAYKDSPDWLHSVDKAIDKLSTPADWTENFVRFVSGDMARQVLDAAGVSKSDPLYWSTISAVVNKVNGNYVTNQRAGLFQGWLGSAVGLFQTYQFNLINQFTKHIANNKAAARQMMALQTGIFGAQSLPGFSLLNEYLGNKTLGEKDIYSTVGDALDTPVSEFLLYGGGSSLTRPILGGEGISLFTRGNLNPRTVTIIPTTLSEIPAAQVIANGYKFMDNLVGGMLRGETAGAAVSNALAHNGMNRPLQGLAQLIAGARTTSKGTTLMSYEDASWATAITKLMGTSTLSEDIAVNAYYRSMGYRAQRMQSLANLAKVTRQNLRSAGDAAAIDTTALLKEYISRGGNARTFHRWYMNQVTGAQDGIVATAASKLRTPEGRYLQGLLGQDVGGINMDSLGSF